MYQHFLSRVQPGALALCLLSLGFSSFFLMSLLQGVYVISPVQQISPCFENFSHTHNCVSSFPNNCCMDGNSYLFDICRDTEVHNLHKLSYFFWTKRFTNTAVLRSSECHVLIVTFDLSIPSTLQIYVQTQIFHWMIKHTSNKTNTDKILTVACCDVHIYAL